MERDSNNYYFDYTRNKSWLLRTIIPMKLLRLNIFFHDGDGDFFVEKAATTKKVGVLVRPNGNVKPCYRTSDPPTFPVTFKVGFTETDNYKACSVELTITA